MLKPIKRIFAFIFLSTILVQLQAQTVSLFNTNSKASLRGMSVVDDQTLWVSGSDGSVGKSLDGGNSWKWMTVKGFEKTDFRAIEAFDVNTAVIMGVDEPAYILRTTDGGNNWQPMYQNKTKGMFLDAMDFLDNKHGIVIGDPINNQFFMAQTWDGGKHWKELPSNLYCKTDSGEACFASSGTNIKMLNKKKNVFVSGGLKSNLFLRNQKMSLPILQGVSTTGANSIALKNSKTMIIVGGDFMKKNDTIQTCCITTNGGKSFAHPVVGLHGYRSCVAYLGETNWVACGLNGVDYSIDEGKHWQWISTSSFNVCRKAKKGDAVFFAGAKGAIGKLKFGQ